MNSILLPKISRSYILLFCAFIGPMLLGGQVLYANLALYTPYTEISVPPGESIEYTIDVINNGGGIRTAAVSLTGLPEGWNYTLTSGGWTLQKISVLPREKKSLTLRVEVPFKVDKGSYTVGMAPTYGINLCFGNLLCRLLYGVYEKGNPVQIGH